MTASPTDASSPASPRPVRMAATLIVLRDANAGLEVLMLRRAEKANDQNSGASVFPGGVIDAHDRGLHGCCSGLDDRAASERLEVPDGGLDYYAAAIRECFEEAGLLFATDSAGRPVTLDGLPPGQLAEMRHAAEQGTDALLSLCAQHGWKLAADRLAYFSHWLTPPGMPRRFDTRFFLATMPEAQSVRPDGRETVEHMWLRPADAVDPARGLKLMNVTRRILLELARFQSVQELMAHARGLKHIPRVMPRLADGPKGRRPVNMEEPSYEEVGFVDPDGEGGGRYAHEAGLAMRLSARVLRVTGEAGDGSGTLVHGYFVGTAGGDCALIYASPASRAHAEALAAAAPGHVRWLLSTQAPSEDALRELWPGASAAVPAPGEQIRIGDATLRVLPGDGDAQSRRFLLVEEGLLFTGASDAPAAGEEQVRWIAPRQGFLHSRR
ncbi:8-oxo-dGTP pyrophosphatase MutT (NUDIX family) [Variovorax paradoxus]|uniref:NUDIX hydrolase n=1 Tax=Variovorax atrisoli TaxID=3394203 RepID=UPI00119C4547|nr:NUDIX domain-containing protein [Variovorax paradoxus]MDR6523017.1 8-oxo-dGTP pyrophosphatase MutT (NUDIX family) [Variovorax paradoxus]